MNNLRLTIVLFILAAALAPALLVSWTSGQESRAVQAPAASPHGPVVPPGFKTAPWQGVSKKRADGAKPLETAAQPAPGAAPDPAAEPPTAPEAHAPVLVELFTSEGCSSCPPAEKVINDLAAAEPTDSRVLYLAYHVDYWDNLGWKDRFADKAFSDRQRAYAAAFASGSVYTPQTIINGELAFVGSDRIQTERSLSEAKRRPTTMSISAMHQELKPGQAVAVTIERTSAAGAEWPKDLRLCAAIVEDGLTTTVARGENQGRTLKHDRVVRAFTEITPSDPARPTTLELTLPADLKPDKATIVVFAQDTSTMKVLAAARAKPRTKD
ncbi:MAG: DUF1223 domain-containing protein [Phycisphaerales bacterium]